ncbi:1051_t:CDS:2 [Funneliformis mosseae]|uniref:1051_t:CDS:1 n=1 Tax=Funneliformis mosseae TaxID=27381 RepID=A0A9N9EH68_FUNMO|nr:1051_t:CDS:2 [Funneliformis mosseae]
MEDLMKSCFNREIEDNIFADVYEERIWKTFTDSNNHNILNLICHIRFYEENTFVIGIIPGPHEPDAGQVIKSPNYLIGRIYCAALIMISCDASIIGGFSSHSSKRDCYKCDYTFSMIQNNNTGHWKPNFGNFNTDLPQRLREKH